MQSAETLRIEVAYAFPDAQHVAVVKLAAGTSVRIAIERSGLLRKFPEIDLARNRLGVFGRLVHPDDLVRDGDRVEIYRPLSRDPKQARRELAALGRTMGKPQR